MVLKEDKKEVGFLVEKYNFIWVNWKIVFLGKLVLEVYDFMWEKFLEETIYFREVKYLIA